MVKIIFEAHSTTLDNEAYLSSGQFDVELSTSGIQQSKELGKRRNGEHFDAIFCSDLQRSYKTAKIAFGSKFPIIKDARLRECDYGDLTQHPSELDDLKKNYDGKKVMIIGHRATQYGLEHWIQGKSLIDLVGAKFKWQPGWEYELN